MKRLLATLLFATMTLNVAMAQPPGGRGEHGGRRSPNAVLAAIDSNGDHEITTDEMKNAFAALQKLDANKNGKLDRSEIHPDMAGGPGGRRGPHASGGPGADADARPSVVQRIKSFDKNKDGKLTKDEIPARMQQLVARHDKNKDKMLDKEELAAMSEQLAATVPGREGRGGPRGRRGGQRSGPGGQRGGPGGGRPSPEQMIQDAFEFDANKDGQLSKAELKKFADSHAQRQGPGGGGRGGRGGRAGGDRPARPDRPE